jgi:hypothetical protein
MIEPTGPEGAGVAVGVAVGEAVAVAAGVAVDVGVAVGVRVGIGLDGTVVAVGVTSAASAGALGPRRGSCAPEVSKALRARSKPATTSIFFKGGLPATDRREYERDWLSTAVPEAYGRNPITLRVRITWVD